MSLRTLRSLVVLGLCLVASHQQTVGDEIPSRVASPATQQFVRKFRLAREPARTALLAQQAAPRNIDPHFPEALWHVIDAANRRKTVPPSILQAAALLGTYDDEPTGARVVSLLEAPDPRLSMVALEALGARGRPDDLFPILATAQRDEFAKHYAYRHAVVFAAAGFREPAAVGFLVDLLPQTTGQLRYETARHLESLTGEAYGGQADRWQQWWRLHHTHFRPRDEVDHPVRADDAEMPWDEPRPAFFDVPIYAYRVVFVIDVSKSMLSSVDGQTRLRQLQLELHAAIDGLPSGASFDIVPFNDAVMPWKGKLVPATEANVREAHEFIDRLAATGKTAVYDALATGLAIDPDLEALVFLSDGRPTAGRITGFTPIRERITDANRFRRVAIHTIAVDSRDGELGFLERLAESNFGEHRLIR